MGRSEELHTQASAFQKQGQQLRRRMWCAVGLGQPVRPGAGWLGTMPLLPERGASLLRPPSALSQSPTAACAMPQVGEHTLQGHHGLRCAVGGVRDFPGGLLWRRHKVHRRQGRGIRAGRQRDGRDAGWGRGARHASGRGAAVTRRGCVGVTGAAAPGLVARHLHCAF
jgi:hypothetical protein